MANSESRWQRIGYWDFVCWFYYLALFVSFCTMFDWPIDFRESFGTNTPARKFLALSAFWGFSVLFAQTAMGWKWIPKIFWHMVKFPFSSIKIVIGFLNDSKKKVRGYTQRLPLTPLFF